MVCKRTTFVINVMYFYAVNVYFIDRVPVVLNVIYYLMPKVCVFLRARRIYLIMIWRRFVCS